MLAGASKEIVASPLPRTATTFVGASGTVAGVTELLAVEEALAPTPLVAVTVKVYATPLVKPVTVIGEALPEAEKPPISEVTV